MAPRNLGEFRVGIDFNPSGDDAVGFIKYKAASLINDIDGIVIDAASAAADPRFAGEVARLKAHAMTLVEDAAMNAVKAITKKPNI